MYKQKVKLCTFEDCLNFMRNIFIHIYVFISVLTLAPFALSASSLPKDSVSATDYYIEGVKEYAGGNLKEAEILMRRSIAKDSSNDAAYYYIAAIYMQQEKIEEAIRYIDDAVRLDPENDWYRLTCARLYNAMGENGFAISTYEELIKRNPKKSSYYYELIELYTQNGDYAKAIGTLDRIEGSSGMNEISGSVRYELLVRDGKYEEAENVLMEMNRRFPTAQNCFMLGDIYKSRYNDTTALYYYDRALALDPEYSPAYFGKAEIYRIKNDIPHFFENIIVFMADRNMNPLWKSDYVQQVIFPSGIVPAFRNECDTLMGALLQAHPKDTSILSTAAFYYIGIDSTARGLQILKQNIKYNPKSLSVHNDYLAHLYAMQDWATLIIAAETAVDIFPNDLTLNELIALAYWQQDSLEKAADRYKKILSILPEGHPMTINCYASLGDISHTAGNSRAAYRYYEKGLKINSEYLPILNNYAYFLSEERKHLKKALKMSKKTIELDPDNYTYLDTYGWLLYLTGNYTEAKIHLKNATIYGGKDSAVILDHYAETLFALEEYNLAFLYWSNADKIDPSLNIAAKSAQKRATIKR